MKIYAITAGDYENHHIVGLTTSKEAAYKMIEEFGDNSEVEEYEDFSEQLNSFDRRPIYQIGINTKTGFVNPQPISKYSLTYKEFINDPEKYKIPFKGYGASHFDKLFGSEKKPFQEIGYTVYFDVQADNLEEAKGLALEKYHQWKKETQENE